MLFWLHVSFLCSLLLNIHTALKHPSLSSVIVNWMLSSYLHSAVVQWVCVDFSIKKYLISFGVLKNFISYVKVRERDLSPIWWSTLQISLMASPEICLIVSRVWSCGCSLHKCTNTVTLDITRCLSGSILVEKLP